MSTRLNLDQGLEQIGAYQLLILLPMVMVHHPCMPRARKFRLRRVQVYSHSSSQAEYPGSAGLGRKYLRTDKCACNGLTRIIY